MYLLLLFGPSKYCGTVFHWIDGTLVVCALISTKAALLPWVLYQETCQTCSTVYVQTFLSRSTRAVCIALGSDRMRLGPFWRVRGEDGIALTMRRPVPA